MIPSSTPTQVGQKHMLANIDTKCYDGHEKTAMIYGGLHTPPHSIQGGRRPSLPYSAVSDTPAPPSSVASAFSQPTTPFQAVAQHGRQFPGKPFQGPWADCTSLSPDGFSADGQMWAIDRAPESGLHSPGPSVISETGGMSYTPAYVSARDTSTFGTLMSNGLPEHGTWPIALDPTTNFREYTADIGAGIHISHGLDLQTTPCVSMPHSAVSSFDGPSFPSLSIEAPSFGSSSSFDGPAPVAIRPPQIIVPSQLSPQYDSTTDRMHDDSDMQDEAYFGNFPSSAADFADYEMVRAASPQETYFSGPDAEDWVDVREAAMEVAIDSSPSRPPPTRPSAASRRRSQRRSTNSRSATDGRTLIEYENYGVSCAVEHLRIETDARTGEVSYIPVGASGDATHKPIPCSFVGADGRACGSRFRRGEHLKRHWDSCHNPECRYVCPLPGCVDKKTGLQRRIKRSDNAGDHFKTHLRDKPRGRRNKGWKWPEVRAYILASYDDGKMAEKLVENLQHWVDRGMAEPGKIHQSKARKR